MQLLRCLLRLKLPVSSGWLPWIFILKVLSWSPTIDVHYQSSCSPHQPHLRGLYSGQTPFPLGRIAWLDACTTTKRGKAATSRRSSRGPPVCNTKASQTSSSTPRRCSKELTLWIPCSSSEEGNMPRANPPWKAGPILTLRLGAYATELSTPTHPPYKQQFSLCIVCQC